MFLRIIRLGWKNVWRSPTRSGVVIIAVLLGTWAGLFISAFFNGMAQGYLKNQLNLSIGHIQITHPRFEDQFNPQYDIEQREAVMDTLRSKPYITAILPQSLSTGLAQSASNSFGVTIHGVRSGAGRSHPIREHIEQGDFLESVSRNPAVVGVALADRLNLELRSKIVLSFQDVNGEITAGAFRVAGIYDASNDAFEKSNLFVEREDLNRLLGRREMIHKVTLKVDDFTSAQAHTGQLAALLPELRVVSWAEIAPELEYVYSAMDISLYIIMIIIIIALVFSIINTMLMAILDRTRELGMLMAVGMNQPRLFLMVLSETFFLTMAGAPLGLFLSWVSIALLEDTGINLSAFAEGLNAYGIGTVIYPEISAAYYLNIALMIAAAALLSSLYPAWKTLKLKPVEAIRKV
ncbi:MAG: FtsX-like permease family protein [Balneolaceae bacterium]|nr:FtsX-like permease family protein [Balneolaceae bacterium]